MDRPDRVEISLPMNEKIAIQKVVCRGCLGCADGCAKLYTAYREAEIDRIQQYWFGNQAFKHKATKQILALFPDIEEAKKQRDIQWVKFLMHEKHYMSDIPPTDYGQAQKGD